MNYKPYSEKDKKISDYKAKVLSSLFMMREGKFNLLTPIKDQQEAYKSYDIIMVRNKDGKEVRIESEQKRVWVEHGKWHLSFLTLDVPFRKNESKADVFIMSNLHWDTIAVTYMKDVLKSRVYKKNTKCSNVKTQLEPFFAVDLDRIRFFKAISDDRKKWVEIDKYGNLK